MISAKHKIYSKKKEFKGTFNGEIPGAFGVSPSEQLFSYKRRLPVQQKRDRLAEQVLESVLPPSFLVDSQQTIVQIINNVNPFLEIRSGSFNQNLANLLPKEISAVVTNIIRRLRDKQETVLFENVKMVKNDQISIMSIEGKVIQSGDEQPLYLIMFRDHKTADPPDEKREVIHLEDQYKDQLTELQNELQFTKENLQATVEELETSNEELQASNEELIAGNEELQSTNEELQSVNEELYTVNSEYQDKIEELTQLNSDVNNLLANTGIAALYLDRKMRIRKFTDGFSKVSQLQENDTGRPVTELAAAFVYKGFMEDVLHVQQTLQPVEKEVTAEDGELYLLRIVPYRTDYQAVDGILITMVNISLLKKEREELNESSNRLNLALEMGNMAWWEWDVRTGKVKMHEKKATMAGYTPEEFPDDVYKICELIHPDDYEETMQNMRDCLGGKTTTYDVVYRIKMKNGNYRWYYDKGGVVERDGDGKPVKVVGLVADMSGLKKLEEDLEKRMEQS